MTPVPLTGLDRYTRIADLGLVVHNFLRPSMGIFGGLIAGTTILLYYAGNAGWISFLLMGLGTLVALLAWRGRGIGLPLLPTLAIQHMVAYGTPILNDHETLAAYPAEYLTQAGWEVCLLLIILSFTWRMGMEMFQPGTGYAYALRLFDAEGASSRSRFAFILVLSATSYQLLDSMKVIGVFLEVLPNGTYSLISALVNAITLAGYFLLAMLVGGKNCGPLLRGFFWGSFTINLLLISSSFLLSSSIILVAAVLIGLFWSSGRIPWGFLALVGIFISFLHLGKFEMRERYWESADNDAVPTATLVDLPARYVEWIDASYSNLAGEEDPSNVFGPPKRDTASMLDRVNNLQNLLFAINAVDGQRIPTLDGATYSLIPPLLIPRVLWPDKPRTHEGQILLNTHFGRQTLSATYKTYIAWGLLPEAYGNFGGIWGAVVLGAVLGLFLAWIENITANKPLLSLEGLVTFALFTGLAISFEMVSSVLVTSLFQSITVIVLACIPFVDRTLVVRPGELNQ